MPPALPAFPDIAAAHAHGEVLLADVSGPDYPYHEPPEDPEFETFPTVSLRDLESRPPRQWVVDGFLLEESLNGVVGMPGSGKSFLVLDILAHIACGLAWMGRRTKSGPVVYQAGEGSAGLRYRLRAWLDQHPEASEDALVANFHIIEQSIGLCDQGGRDARVLANTVAKYRPVAVAVDTLARAFGGGDENNAGEMSRVVERLDRLKTASHAAVFIVHHTTKDGMTARGSGAFLGALDSEINVKTGTEAALVVQHGKLKDQPSWQAMGFNFASHGPSVALVPAGPVARSTASSIQVQMPGRMRDLF